MKFTKMQGAGNDYIYIDCFNENVVNPSELAKIMSDRNFGVGSDGLILINKSNLEKNSKKAIFKMDMYNADGSKAEMCGNGLRCFAKYVYDEGKIKDKSFYVETGRGILDIEITKTDSNNKAELIKINMGNPILEPDKIPIIWKKDIIISEKLPVHGTYLKFTAVSMGNPHCVIFLDDEEALYNLNIKHYGEEIENLDVFPNKTNVEFVFVKNKTEIYQRTWERGTGETLACGTGACASVVAGVLNNYLEKNSLVTNHLKGGDLKIEWVENNNTVYLEGPAVRVFDGNWLL